MRHYVTILCKSQFSRGKKEARDSKGWGDNHFGLFHFGKRKTEEIGQDEVRWDKMRREKRQDEKWLCLMIKKNDWGQVRPNEMGWDETLSILQEETRKDKKELTETRREIRNYIDWWKRTIVCTFGKRWSCLGALRKLFWKMIAFFICFFRLLRDLPEAGPCTPNKITEIYVKALQPWWNGTLPQARWKLSSASHWCFENTSLSDRDHLPKVDYFA